jgi:hypothetical protein
MFKTLSIEKVKKKTVKVEMAPMRKRSSSDHEKVRKKSKIRRSSK